MAHLDAYLAPIPGYGWSGGPTFKTQIVEMKSGRERRNAEWSRARHQFTAPFNNISADAYRNIKQMYLVCRGMLHAFRFRDWLDYTATAEQFGTGDGTTKVYQLSKTSTIDGVSYVRGVYALPAVPTITVNGTGTYAFTADLRRGTITFDTAPANGAVLRWSGEFDLWVRFATDSIPFSLDNPGRTNGEVSVIEVEAPAVGA